MVEGRLTPSRPFSQDRDTVPIRNRTELSKDVRVFRGERMKRKSRWARPVRPESGFTLIEASIAMAIIALVAAGLAVGLMGGLRATRDARLFQQATALGDAEVETSRDTLYDNLVMVTSDLAGDARVLPGPSMDPDGTGPLLVEPIVSAPSGGSISPHIFQETVDNYAFTISRYVTWVDDTVQGGPARSYKRFVVLIEWTSGGRTNTYRTSAFITRARRGLPVPKFELAPAEQELEVQPGNTVVFAHGITNLGIVDAYDLQMPVPGGRTWAITFYKDVDQDGLYTVGIDTPLVDTNFTGVVDTGNVSTGQTTYLLAVWTLSPLETLGTETLTLTATSGANDAHTRTATDTLDIGTVGITLYLHNRPTPPTGNTTAQKNTPMTVDAPTASTLYQYSTNYYSNNAGRFVDKKTTTSGESSTNFMANWVYQVPATTTYNGTAELEIWVALKDLKCDKTVNFNVFLREKATSSTDTGTQFASGVGVAVPQGAVEPCNFRLITVTMPVNRTINTNQWIELKVTVLEATGDAGLFAYDTPAFESKLTLPQVAT